jgi:hypothetical protein
MRNPREMSDEELRSLIAKKYGDKWDVNSVDVRDPIVAELLDRLARGRG